MRRGQGGLTLTPRAPGPWAAHTHGGEAELSVTVLQLSAPMSSAGVASPSLRRIPLEERLDGKALRERHDVREHSGRCGAVERSTLSAGGGNIDWGKALVAHATANLEAALAGTITGGTH